MKQVIITIDEDGQAHIETKGFSGKSCTETTDKIIAGAKSLGTGTDTKKITYTAEYNAQETQQVRAGA